MTIDKTLLNSMLDNLKSQLNKIEDMDVSLEQILEDEDIQDLLDRRMQVALECCIDIAAHLATGMSLPRQEHASDVFLLLGKNELIPKELAEKMAQATGFRNILVHEYTQIDYKLAYSDLNEKLEDLKSFGRQVVGVLNKN